MKRIIRAAGLALILSAGGPAFAADKTITLAVDGMTCASCPYMVKKSLTKVDGVKAVDVTLQTKLAVVTYDDAKTNVEAITDATFQAGFPSALKVTAATEPSSTKAKPAPAPRGSH